MAKRKAVLFFVLAVVSSSLGWLSLNYGIEGTQFRRADVQSLGLLLVIFGAGYLLLSLVLAMRGMNKLPYISDERLAATLSIAAFLSSLPLAVIFNLNDKPTLTIIIVFVLTWPPLSIYLSYRTDHED